MNSNKIMPYIQNELGESIFAHSKNLSPVKSNEIQKYLRKNSVKSSSSSKSELEKYEENKFSFASYASLPSGKNSPKFLKNPERLGKPILGF